MRNLHLTARKLVASMLCVTACGEDPGRETVTLFSSAHDSVIRVYSEEELGRRSWSFPSEPEVVVGAGPDEPSFYQVIGAVLLAEVGHGLAIADASSSEVLIFDSVGRLTGSIGGEGEGPGEYRQIAFLGRFGRGSDTLLVYDSYFSRADVFLSDGTLIDSDSIPRLGAPFGPRIEGMLNGRQVIGRASFDHEYESGLHRDSSSIVRLRRGSLRVDTFATLVGDERFTIPGERVRTPVPYGATLQVSAGTGGIAVAATDKYRVVTIGPDGELRWIVFVDRPRVALLERDVVRWRDAQLETREEASHEAVERMLAQIPAGDSMPLIEDLFVDDEGQVWVQELLEVSPTNRWVVFGSGGELLGDIVLPSGSSPINAAGSWILTLDVDSLGRETVSVWRNPIQ